MTIEEFLKEWCIDVEGSSVERVRMREDLDKVLVAYQTKIDDVIRAGAGIPEGEWKELFAAAKKLDDDMYIHDKVPSLGQFSKRVMDILPRLANAAAVAKAKLKTSEESARNMIESLDKRIEDLEAMYEREHKDNRFQIAMRAPDMPSIYLEKWKVAHRPQGADHLHPEHHTVGAWFAWPWYYADMMLEQEHAGKAADE